MTAAQARKNADLFLKKKDGEMYHFWLRVLCKIDDKMVTNEEHSILKLF